MKSVNNIQLSRFISKKSSSSTQHIVFKSNTYNARFFTNSKPNEDSSTNVTPILGSLVKQFYPENPSPLFKGTLLAGVQHMLSTTVDMFSILKQQGLEEAIVTGKSYSNHLPSIKKFADLGYEFIEESEQLGYGRFQDSMREATYRVWDNVVQHIKKQKAELIITLDDGADLLLTTPPKLFNGIAYKPNAVIGIEQTRGGSNRSAFSGLPFPIINVAGSCLKNVIEYPKVAKNVAQKVSALVKNEIGPQLNKKPIIGIIGNGSMGKAMTEKLVSEGYTVYAYDKNHTRKPNHAKVLNYPEASLLIMSADIIIGCTGQDITASPPILNAFLYSSQNKWLISTGSKDVEFNTLLETIQNNTKTPGHTPDPLKNIEYENQAGFKLNIMRGGFPINFDNSAHSVPPAEIWPTRAALLLACSMSANLYQTQHPALKTASILKLDPYGQLLILKAYQKLNPEDECLKVFQGLTDSDAIEYIQQHSEGEIVVPQQKNVLQPHP